MSFSFSKMERVCSRLCSSHSQCSVISLRELPGEERGRGQSIEQDRGRSPSIKQDRGGVRALRKVTSFLMVTQMCIYGNKYQY